MLCICPLPEKMPSTAGIIRFISDTDQIVQPQIEAVPAGTSRESVPDNWGQPSTLVTNIISVSVMRI
jgi:hypothetical protein